MHCSALCLHNLITCLETVHLHSSFRLHPSFPDGYFPLIVHICQNYHSLRVLLGLWDSSAPETSMANGEEGVFRHISLHFCQTAALKKKKKHVMWTEGNEKDTTVSNRSLNTNTEIDRFKLDKSKLPASVLPRADSSFLPMRSCGCNKGYTSGKQC